MTTYQRPHFPELRYLDERGEPVRYGDRWVNESPPEDSYSRISNLERFTPLHTVADALISWLNKTYDVEVMNDLAVVSDLIHVPDDAIRAVRLVPRSPSAARITFVMTAYPMTYLHAGVLHDFSFPVCACDACDEDAEGLAAQMEWTVRMVVGGGYSEHLDNWPSKWVEYKLEEPDVGMRSSRSRTSELPPERLRNAKDQLPKHGQWEPWPVRR